MTEIKLKYPAENSETLGIEDEYSKQYGLAQKKK